MRNKPSTTMFVMIKMFRESAYPRFESGTRHVAVGKYASRKMHQMMRKT